MNVVCRSCARDPRFVLLPRARVATPLLALLLLLVVVGLSCRPDPQLPPDVVARLGNHDITVAELQREARRRGVATGTTDAETEQLRQNLLEGLLDDAALYQRAVEAGLDRQPEIQRRFRQWVVQAYREHESGTNAPAALSEAEVQDAYARLAPRFTDPGAIRLGLIWVRSSAHADPERRQAHRASLETARARVARATDPATVFREQVEQLSEDQATRYRGGDSGWLARGVPWRWPEEVAAAAQQLTQLGELSPVIDTPNGYYLLRLSELRPPRLSPLAAVRAEVEREARQASAERQARQLIQRARSGLVPVLNPPALAAVELPSRESLPVRPPTFPTSDHASSPAKP